MKKVLNRNKNIFERNPKKTIALFILLVFILFLVFFEIALRLMYSSENSTLKYEVNRPPKGFFELKNDGRAFGLVPNYSGRLVSSEFNFIINTNDFGIRDNRNNDAIVGSNKKKIMVMGDSFSFGYGVDFDEIYSTRLEKMLEKEGYDYLVFSTGYDDGFSPVQYELYLRKYFDLFRPDIVIMGFFMQNDLHDQDIIKSTRGQYNEIIKQELIGQAVIDGYLVEIRRKGQNASCSLNIKAWLYLNTAIYRKIVDLKNRVIAKIFKKENNPGRLPYFFLDEKPAGSDISCLVCLDSIIDMNQYVASKGKKLIVFFIPSNFQISKSYQSAMKKNFNYSKILMHKAYEVSQPQTWMKKTFKDKGIFFIDPTDRFRLKNTDKFQLYLDYDSHWNKNGHIEAANVIKDALIAGHLVEK